MSNRAIGVGFIGIAAFVSVIPYFTASIWVSGVGVSLQVFNELFLGICVVPLICKCIYAGRWYILSHQRRKGRCVIHSWFNITSSGKNNPFFYNQCFCL